jgi:pentatricopeptide repeat protein
MYLNTNKFNIDSITFASLTASCSRKGDYKFGEKIHKHMKTSDFKLNMFIYNTLIKLYTSSAQLGLGIIILDLT